jgi:hypothetical protein
MRDVSLRTKRESRDLGSVERNQGPSRLKPLGMTHTVRVLPWRYWPLNKSSKIAVSAVIAALIVGPRSGAH